MKRRSFIFILLGSISILVSDFDRLIKSLTPRKFTQADITKRYPGKIKSLDNREMRKIAPWSG